MLDLIVICLLLSIVVVCVLGLVDIIEHCGRVCVGVGGHY